MTAASATNPPITAMGGSRHFLLRRLHSLTGILFGLYLIIHLVVNATIVQGGIDYQQQVDKIHALPFLLVVEWIAIYIPILFHAIYGFWIILTGQPNAASYPYLKNFFYLLQRVSAVILVIFIVFHVFAMKGLLRSRHGV